MLIPTKHKAKIGHDQAYPIGAQRLSAAIGDIPVVAQMEIDFLAPRASKSVEWNDDQKPYCILELIYRNRDPGLVTYFWEQRDGMPRRWRIRVVAVQRDDLSIIKALLDDALKIRARPWLLAQETNENREGNARFTLLYDPFERQLFHRVYVELMPSRVGS